MAGPVPAIHVFACSTKDVDARDKPGHDDAATTDGVVPTLAESAEQLLKAPYRPALIGVGVPAIEGARAIREPSRFPLEFPDVYCEEHNALRYEPEINSRCRMRPCS
jgi:hypothetical protein